MYRKLIIFDILLVMDLLLFKLFPICRGGLILFPVLYILYCWSNFCRKYDVRYLENQESMEGEFVEYD